MMYDCVWIVSLLLMSRLLPCMVAPVISGQKDWKETLALSIYHLPNTTHKHKNTVKYQKEKGHIHNCPFQNHTVYIILLLYYYWNHEHINVSALYIQCFLSIPHLNFAVGGKQPRPLFLFIANPFCFVFAKIEYCWVHVNFKSSYIVLTVNLFVIINYCLLVTVADGCHSWCVSLSGLAESSVCIMDRHNRFHISNFNLHHLTRIHKTI